MRRERKKKQLIIINVFIFLFSLLSSSSSSLNNISLLERQTGNPIPDFGVQNPRIQFPTSEGLAPYFIIYSWPGVDLIDNWNFFFPCKMYLNFSTSFRFICFIALATLTQKGRKTASRNNCSKESASRTKKKEKEIQTKPAIIKPKNRSNCKKSEKHFFYVFFFLPLEIVAKVLGRGVLAFKNCCGRRQSTAAEMYLKVCHLLF